MESGQDRLKPPRRDRLQAGFGEHISPNWPEIGVLSLKFDQPWPGFDNIWASSTNLDTILAKFGPGSEEHNETGLPDFGPFLPRRTTPSTSSGASWGPTRAWMSPPTAPRCEQQVRGPKRWRLVLSEADRGPVMRRPAAASGACVGQPPTQAWVDDNPSLNHRARTTQAQILSAGRFLPKSVSPQDVSSWHAAWSVELDAITFGSGATLTNFERTWPIWL